MGYGKDVSVFHGIPGPWRAVALSLLVFGLGIMVYLWDRSAGTTLLLPVAFGHRAGEEMIFGALGGALPSFAHAFAFSLITAIILGRTAAARRLGCLGWWSIGFLFELGQHPALHESLASTLPGWLGNYFVRGTFDVLDLVATTFGAAIGYFIHFWISGKRI